MSPLRWDVLITGFVLAVPVLLLGLRGDLSADDVALRLVWCLAAGWTAVALMRFATAPRTPAAAGRGRRTSGPADQAADGEPATS
jgi:hypothetical protein